MVDTAAQNTQYRGQMLPNHHLETLPDGRQVLVNDRTGYIAVTDQNGQVTAEVPRSQFLSQAPDGGAPSGGAQPPGVTAPKTSGSGTPMPGLPGGTYNPAPYQPGGGGSAIQPKQVLPSGAGTPAVPATAVPPSGGPPTNTPANRAAGMTSGNVVPRGPAQPTVDQGPQRPAPGAAGYDLWAMNDMLKDNGYNGWTVTGVTPIQEVDKTKNPLFDPSNPNDPTNPETFDTPKNSYVINIRNPNTNDIKTLKFAKVWEDPSKPGVYTASDPGNGTGWGFQLNDIVDQQKADPNKIGHSGQMQIGDTLWGTNNSTGVFEPIPGAPPIPKSWTGVTTGKDASGNTVWYGIDPADGKPKQIPDMPVVPKDKEAWGDPTLIDRGDGTKVWYGVDPADKQLKQMPGMPTVAAKPTGPGSITQNNVTYTQNPDGSYSPAKGIPDPNPPKGTAQVKLGTDGYLYQQISNGDGTFTPDTSFTPVPFTDAAKQAHAQVGAVHQAGEKGTKVIGGYVYNVTYRGGSDDNYDVDTSTPAKKMPGTEGPPTAIPTPSDQPKIAQRMPDGSIQYVENQNYQPTDPAQRTAQLSSQASAKLAEIQAKIGTGGYTPDQAQQEYDQWWDANIEPAKQELQQAQQQKQVDYQLKLNQDQRAAQEQRRADFATAQTTGQQTLDAYKTTMPYMVGPGFGQALNTIANNFGKPNMPNVDIGSAVTFQMPDINALAQQATNQALAHISPTAASNLNAATGANTPNYGPGLPQTMPGYDVTQGLNRQNYQMPGATTTVSPDGTVHVQQNAAQQQPQPQPQPQFTNLGPFSGTMPLLNTAPGGVAPDFGTYRLT
jgi:hypothetical protein